MDQLPNLREGQHKYMIPHIIHSAETGERYTIKKSQVVSTE